MATALFILALLSFLGGLGVIVIAESAIHEIEALVLFLMASVLLSGASIVVAIVRSQQNKAEVGSGNARRCPSCAEMILGEAIVCKHCGRDVEPLAEVDLPTIAEPVFRPTNNKVCPGCGEKIGWLASIKRFEGQQWHYKCSQREKDSR